MFSRTSGEAGLIGLIDKDRAYAAARFCLGYGTVSTDPVKKLLRIAGV